MTRSQTRQSAVVIVIVLAINVELFFSGSHTYPGELIQAKSEVSKASHVMSLANTSNVLT